MAGSEPVTGSVTITRSTSAPLLLWTIFAPKASSSERSLTTAAPSTAVIPATASTALRRSSSHSSSRSASPRASSSCNSGKAGSNA
jgi:hypothetical protein